MARSSGWTAAPQYNPLTANRQPQSLARRRFLNCPHLARPRPGCAQPPRLCLRQFAAVACAGAGMSTRGDARGGDAPVASVSLSRARKKARATLFKKHQPRDTCQKTLAREYVLGNIGSKAADQTSMHQSVRAGRVVDAAGPSGSPHCRHPTRAFERQIHIMRTD
jgi:hypothetical protein